MNALFAAPLQLSATAHRVATFALLALAMAWLLRHFMRQRKSPGCGSCPQQAPRREKKAGRVSLPIIDS